MEQFDNTPFESPAAPIDSEAFAPNAQISSEFIFNPEYDTDYATKLSELELSAEKNRALMAAVLRSLTADASICDKHTITITSRYQLSGQDMEKTSKKDVSAIVSFCTSPKLMLLEPDPFELVAEKVYKYPEKLHRENKELLDQALKNVTNKNEQNMRKRFITVMEHLVVVANQNQLDGETTPDTKAQPA